MMAQICRKRPTVEASSQKKGGIVMAAPASSRVKRAVSKKVVCHPKRRGWQMVDEQNRGMRGVEVNALRGWCPVPRDVEDANLKVADGVGRRGVVASQGSQKSVGALHWMGKK